MINAPFTVPKEDEGSSESLDAGLEKNKFGNTLNLARGSDPSVNLGRGSDPSLMSSDMSITRVSDLASDSVQESENETTEAATADSDTGNQVRRHLSIQ